MKKLGLTLMAVLLAAVAVNAQTTKKLLSLKASNGIGVTFEYNAEGKVVKTTEETDPEVKSDKSTSTYEYSADKITQTYSTDSGTPDVRIATIENGRIVSESVKFKVQGTLEDATLTYTYNANNELVKSVKKVGTEVYEWVYTWTDGDITKIEIYYNSKPNEIITLTYDTSVTNPYILAMNMMWLADFDIEGITPYGQVFGHYYGNLTKHALKSRTAENAPGSVKQEVSDNFVLTYNKDANGEVKSMTTKVEEEDVEFQLEWESTDGIAALQTALPQQETYYNLNGVKLQKLQKGVNIVKNAEGKTRKVVVE